MRGDLHRDYSTTSARHHAIENPISVLSIEKGASRGINHAGGNNGKSFVARCSKRSHWLDTSTGEKQLLQITATMNDDEYKCRSCKSQEDHINYLDMKLYDGPINNYVPAAM